MCLGGREWGAGCSPTAPGRCLHFECRGAPARVPGVEMRGSPPLAPPLCVCGDVYLTLRGLEGELTTELKLGEAVTDERAGVFTPDKNGYTADGAAAGCVPVD